MAEENATQALAPSRGRSPLIPTDLESLYRLAETLSRAGACPAAIRGKPADVFLVLLKGSELGIGMASALANIHIIEGKAVMSADLMVGIAFSHDIVEIWDVVEWTDKVCTIKAKRKGPYSAVVVTWTIEMAGQMGLLTKKGVGGGPGMWIKVPKQMLWARASGEAARRICPDYLSGCYAQEEMDDQQLVREARDITPPTVAPVEPKKTGKPLSLVVRAPLPSLEQGARIRPDAAKGTVSVEASASSITDAANTEDTPHDVTTGEVTEAEQSSGTEYEQGGGTETDAQLVADDTPEILRSLRTTIDTKSPLTRDQLREAIRAINQLDDEAMKLEAKRLYNEASKLSA